VPSRPALLASGAASPVQRILVDASGIATKLWDVYLPSMFRHSEKMAS
jgi:hypothetical protein